MCEWRTMKEKSGGIEMSAYFYSMNGKVFAGFEPEVPIW